MGPKLLLADAAYLEGTPRQDLARVVLPASAPQRRDNSATTEEIERRDGPVRDPRRDKRAALDALPTTPQALEDMLNQSREEVAHQACMQTLRDIEESEEAQKRHDARRCQEQADVEAARIRRRSEERAEQVLFTQQKSGTTC